MADQPEGSLVNRAFLVKRTSSGKWDTYIIKERLNGLLGLGVDEEKLELLNSLAIISVLNFSKGWDWALERSGEVVNFKVEFCLRLWDLGEPLQLPRM